MRTIWKALLNVILSKLNPRDIIGAIVKWLDDYSHGTKTQWDDVPADLVVQLWEKYKEYVPENLQLNVTKRVK